MPGRPRAASRPMWSAMSSAMSCLRVRPSRSAVAGRVPSECGPACGCSRRVRSPVCCQPFRCRPRQKRLPRRRLRRQVIGHDGWAGPRHRSPPNRQCAARPVDPTRLREHPAGPLLRGCCPPRVGGLLARRCRRGPQSRCNGGRPSRAGRGGRGDTRRTRVRAGGSNRRSKRRRPRVLRAGRDSRYRHRRDAPGVAGAAQRHRARAVAGRRGNRPRRTTRPRCRARPRCGPRCGPSVLILAAAVP